MNKMTPSVQTITDKYTIAFTGHRPDKLGGWNNTFEHQRIIGIFANELQKASFATRHLTVISGGALGVDQFAIEATNEIRPYLIDTPIRLVIAEPFIGFQKKWPKKSQDKYEKLLSTAQEIHVPNIDPKNYQEMVIALQKRNEYMVDRADEIWAYWNGSKGGTANCIKYAEKVGRPVRNLYLEYNKC